jgi:hypothetical protein
MIRSKSLLTLLVAGGIGAGTLQGVHAASSLWTGQAGVRQLDEPYPHMHKALEDLKAARHSLDEAEPRFKGHRDKAIDHVDQAIQECNDALAEG